MLGGLGCPCLASLFALGGCRRARCACLTFVSVRRALKFTAFRVLIRASGHARQISLLECLSLETFTALLLGGRVRWISRRVVLAISCFHSRVDSLSTRSAILRS